MKHTKVVGVGDSILRSAVAQLGPYRSAPLSMSYGTEHTALNLKIETGLNKPLSHLGILRPSITKQATVNADLKLSRSTRDCLQVYILTIIVTVT